MSRARPPALLNWAGSKARVAGYLIANGLPEFATYHEPFLGSGAVFFALASHGLVTSSCLSDANARLIDLFRAVQQKPREVLAGLKLHALLDSDVHFSATLARLNETMCGGELDHARAADIIYLLAQSHHSTWYETKEGRISMHRRAAQRRFRPRVEDLNRAAALLAGSELMADDYTSALDRACAADLVFVDPPYLYPDEAADQQGYNALRFNAADLAALLGRLAALSGRGTRVVFCWGDDISCDLPRNWQKHIVGRDYMWLSWPV